MIIVSREMWPIFQNKILPNEQNWSVLEKEAYGILECSISGCMDTEYWP